MSETSEANLLKGMLAGAVGGLVASWTAGADEVALPALGLSDKPAAYPLSMHLYGLVSHAVYGVTTGTVRRIVRG
jgi:hypothetical protein